MTFSTKTVLGALPTGTYFVYWNDPEGRVYKLMRKDGECHWITRVNERGLYSAHMGTQVAKVDYNE